MPHTIIAVLPEGFHFRVGVDVWMPVDTNPPPTSKQHITQIYALGRIADGSTPPDVQEALGKSFESWNHVILEEKKGTELSCSPFGQVELSKADNYALIAALGALIFVMIVSCANVANLLVGRALTRGREMAIRSAVGASRSRIIRQLLTESLLLALFGTIGGLLISAWDVDAISSLEAIKTLSSDVGIPSGLTELGVKEEDLKIMAENAQKDACGLTNPRHPTLEDIIQIYKNAL